VISDLIESRGERSLWLPISDIPAREESKIIHGISKRRSIVSPAAASITRPRPVKSQITFRTDVPMEIPNLASSKCPISLALGSVQIIKTEDFEPGRVWRILRAMALPASPQIPVKKSFPPPSKA
jgi:hypothetical protein